MKHLPTTIVLFGATGDLAIKKIFPALSELYADGILNKDSRVVAVSRRQWSDYDFRRFIIAESKKELNIDFLERVFYSEVEFENGLGYDTLKAKLAELDKKFGSSEKLMYLSLAPRFYIPVISSLKKEKIIKKGHGKILIEKPFGTDLSSAKKIDKLLFSFLSHEQIYRMDHYLGKSTIQAIMRIHEHSRSLGKLISKETVRYIRVRLFETKGIEGRGASYDTVGAFRDVGQNHMIETLAVILAEPPTSGSATAWHNARTKVIESLLPPNNTCELSRRGQYETYTQEKNVAKDSTTETAFEVVTGFSKGELQGVPVILESGKMMKLSEATVVIGFKTELDLPKEIEFKIQPEQKTVIRYADGKEEVLHIPEERDAYANMITDALSGYRSHFVGSKEIEAAWKYADRVVACWHKVPLEKYSDAHPFSPSSGF